MSRDAARRRLADAFRDAGLPGPDLDARVLVCAACGIDHADLVREPDVEIGVAGGTIGNYANRRLAREPVSRILGTREFWGLPFIIGPAVLDPRPETEGLVASLLDAIGGRRAAPFRILDLGTGSGAILCALLSELPAAHGLGIDQSLEASQIARQNVDRLGLSDRAEIVASDWQEMPTGRYDIIACNPPYVPTAEIPSLEPEVRHFDPVAALDGGADGLDPYRYLAPKLEGLLRPGGVVGFECGHDQGAPVADILRAAGLQSVVVYKDLSGLDRVVIGTRA